MLHVEECLIEPELKDARKIASWCKGGTARGMFEDLPDGAMIIFDGYGATHDSVCRALNLKRVTDCFIIQSNGNVLFENMHWGKKCLSKLPVPQEKLALFFEVAKILGNANPICFQSEEDLYT